MEYVFTKNDDADDLDDWTDQLVVREPQDGITKRGPDEDDDLQSVFDDRSHELNRSSTDLRPTLFDTQIAIVSMAAEVVWNEINQTRGGSVVVRHLQLERIIPDRYSALDPSSLEDGIIQFRVEMEASWPQYRRRMVTIPVEVRAGRPRPGLYFLDSAHRKWTLTAESMDRYMCVKDWFRLSRPPAAGLAMIDRVQQTDWPSSRNRPRFTGDIGMI